MDDTPYIIVDNQRIPPIRPSHRPSRSREETMGQTADPFGIVDRVTLSQEGLQRSRERFKDAETTPVADQTTIGMARKRPLLTYSPKMLR